jgi:hypothetical protein
MINGCSQLLTAESRECPELASPSWDWEPGGGGGEGKAWLEVLGAQNWRLETADIKPGLLATCSET